MSSSDSYNIEILIKIPIYLYQYLVPILYVIGNIGNLLCIFIFLKRSWRKNVCVFYFIIFLLNNTVLTNSTLIGSIFSYGFNINAHYSNIFLCKIFYYISYLSSIYYPNILILASIDRLLISSQNVDTRLYSSKRLAYFSVFTSGLLWSIFSLHVLIKVNMQQFGPLNSVCFFDLTTPYLDFFIYSTLVISIVIPLVMIILSILAFKNVRLIQSVPRRQQRNQIRSMNKKDFQLLRCLYIHNIIYIIFTILIVVGVCYAVIIRSAHKSTLMELVVANFLNSFGFFLHCIPYCASFFIFICVSKAFRQELKRFVYKICGKDLTIVREEENIQLEIPKRNTELNDVSTIVLPS